MADVVHAPVGMPGVPRRPLVGVLVSSLSGADDVPWSSLASAARDRGVDLVTFVGTDAYPLASAERLDGVIACVDPVRPQADLREAVARLAPIPVVTIGAAIPGHPSFVTDRDSGMRALVDHLVDEHGARCVAFLAGTTAGTDVASMSSSFANAVSARGVEEPPGRSSAADADDIRGLVREWVEDGAPDAIVVSDEASAQLALATIESLRRDGPMIRVVAFDEAVWANDPPSVRRWGEGSLGVTTVRPRWGAAFGAAIDAVLAAAETSVEVQVETDLVVRESCGEHRPTAPSDVDSQRLQAQLEDARRADSAARARERLVGALGQRLATSLDIGELTDVLADALPSVGVSACFVALYEPALPEGESIGDSARLVLAFDGGQPQPTGRGRRLRSVDLVPDGHLRSRNPRDFVLISLSFGRQRLGYAVFEGSPGAEWVFETLRGHMASAIQGGLLLRRERRAMSAVEEGRRLLEVRVAERTAELAQANAELREQIEVRERAEEAASQLENQLRQAQKMEAIGRLAGGIAHDFNNLLVVINGYSRMLLDAPEPGELWREDLQEIASAGDRAATLTRQLLAFSRQQVVRPTPLDLGRVIEGVDRMLRRLIGDEVDITTESDAELRLVRADEGQIEQVVVNLVVNARDAMPGGGRLLIETRNVETDEVFAAAHVGLSPGRYVVLRVSDTGTGMDDATKARIFDPFFTTKPVGRGTGLGLSTVFGIVEQAGGHITVDTTPGQGSTFSAYFPVLADVGAQVVADPAPDGETLGGSETILLVEDDDGVRLAIERFMGIHGYRVLAAASGSEAVQVSAEYEGVLDLLVTDIKMPGLRGHELAQRVRQVRPQLPILYISGYTDSTPIMEVLAQPRVAMLQKPFTAAVLVAKIREILDQRAG